MFAGKSAIALSILLATATAASAQAPDRIKQFKAWGAYSYSSSKGKICYVLAVPSEKLPAHIDHGQNFFLITQRPGQNISYEPQAMMGYKLKANSKITLTVDTKSFTMFTKGKSGWLENAAEEPALVAAMKAGHSLKVQAISARGTNTSYVYSLSGVTAALHQIESCK